MYLQYKYLKHLHPVTLSFQLTDIISFVMTVIL